MLVINWGSCEAGPGFYIRKEAGDGLPEWSGQESDIQCKRVPQNCTPEPLLETSPWNYHPEELLTTVPQNQGLPLFSPPWMVTSLLLEHRKAQI